MKSFEFINYYEGCEAKLYVMMKYVKYTAKQLNFVSLHSYGWPTTMSTLQTSNKQDRDLNLNLMIMGENTKDR